MHPSSFLSRRTRALAVAVALAGVTALSATACLPPMPPGGAAADCSDIAWGSAAKEATPMSTSPITGVRAAGHHCYDRLVIDLASAPASGWHVQYGSVHAQGTGDVVAVRGGAGLEIVAKAPTYDKAGHSTYAPANSSELVDTAGFQTFRQVVSGGSFEGYSTFGLGVRARLPFRVFAIQDHKGTRLVIDVAHHWA